MATCMAMGEAAGRAAKMAIRTGKAPADIDVAALQRELLDRGAYLRTGEESGVTSPVAASPT
jgi:hypothetical protein